MAISLAIKATPFQTILMICSLYWRAGRAFAQHVGSGYPPSLVLAKDTLRKELGWGLRKGGLLKGLRLKMPF
jgi:hypothetical protein